jgi:hypothetical protein
MFDCDLSHRSTDEKYRANGFLLSMLSPVLYKMVAGCFKETVIGIISLGDVERGAFQQVVSLACGVADLEARDLGHMMVLASVADRFQISEVETQLEDVILRNLSVGVCAEVLLASTVGGLTPVEKAAHRLALERFEDVAATEAFLRIGEDVLGSILDEDDLVASCEEHVFECLLRWMKGADGGQLRGRGLLSRIRFPLMDGKFLALKMYDVFPESHLDWIEGLISEASRVKLISASERAAVRFRLLGPKALVPRARCGVQWARYVGGGERRLDGHTADAVSAVAECQGRMFSGSYGGSIRSWNRTTLAAERVLVDGEAAVLCLREWGGLLISGHGDGRVRVWDVLSGRCDRVLDGHGGDVFALSVCGTRLLTGSEDQSINVWCMGAQTVWPCERTLVGHTNGVIALAAWGDCLVSGSNDRTIRVWAVESGRVEAVLCEHTDSVSALVVHGEWLFSASRDHTVRVWRAGPWELVHTVEVYGPGSTQYVYSLAVCGPHLLTGSADDESGDSDEDRPYEVRGPPPVSSMPQWRRR